MSHISSIGAGLFSDLSICYPTDNGYAWTALDSEAEFKALFASEVASAGGAWGLASTGTYCRVKNVREFPAMGTPPNIVNVPTYGQKTSQQIQGQSDAPNMEVTLNFIPSAWASGTLLGDLVGNGKLCAFRFTLLNAEPANYHCTPLTAGGSMAGSVASPVENTMWFWIGKVEALLVNPQLTDANTATVTVSIQSKFYGAYTVTASS